MFPGKINPRMMRQAMKKMGIQQDVLEGVREVVIRFSDKELVISPASVTKVKAMGGESFQVEGNAVERSLDTTPDISSDDVKTVMDQTGATEDAAKQAIEEAQGDLAAAIMNLSKK